MENFENQIFGFGANDNNDLEQTNNFNYNSISGLGESDYENEDLFSIDEEPVVDENNVTVDNTFNNNVNTGYDFNGFNYRIGGEENNIPMQNTIENPFTIEQPQDIFFNNMVEPTVENVEQPVVEPQFENHTETVEESVSPIGMDFPEYVEPQFNETIPVQENVIQPIEPVTPIDNTFTNETLKQDSQPDFLSIIENLKPVNQEPEVSIQPDEEKIDDIEEFAVEPQPIEENVPSIEPTNYNELEQEPENNMNEIFVQPQIEDIEEDDDDEDGDIVISDTPIEELKNLTKYENQYIEPTDINSLFDKVSVNVQDASEIFKKNTDMKAKIDTRFEELKKLQSEVEASKQKQMDEVNKYKEEVLEKLTEKKEEIEKRLNTLKEYQANLEKEKLEFEKYKKSEQANIDKVQKEVQAAYDDRREELSNIEDALRKQKDELDEERNQLSLDRIQYEADKNELANNLLKFNELVNSFTDGVNSAGRE